MVAYLVYCSGWSSGFFLGCCLYKKFRLLMLTTFLCLDGCLGNYLHRSLLRTLFMWRLLLRWLLKLLLSWLFSVPLISIIFVTLSPFLKAERLFSLVINQYFRSNLVTLFKYYWEVSQLPQILIFSPSFSKNWTIKIIFQLMLICALSYYLHQRLDILSKCAQM